MFGLFKGIKGFNNFHKILDVAQRQPKGSPQALDACNQALHLYEETLPKWPVSRKKYQDFFKGLILMVSSESELILSSCNEEKIIALQKWDNAYQLLRSNNYQDVWVECAVPLGDAYFSLKHLSPFSFTERAIELTLACKENLEQTDGSLYNRAILCAALAEYYSDRLCGTAEENIEKALLEIRKAQSLITLDQYPEDWAMFKCTEADILRKRFLGDHVENMIHANIAHEEADQILTNMNLFGLKAQNSGSWACMMLDYPIGDRENNIEKAIELIDIAYSYRETKGERLDLAKTCINKSSIYAQRIKGDFLENLNIAYACINQARDLYATQSNTFEVIACDTQKALLRLKLHRISPDPKLHESVPILIDALEVHKKHGHQEAIASTANILAEYYSIKSASSHKPMLEQSISVLRDVITNTDNINTHDRVVLQQNLANYLLDISDGRDNQYYEEAVDLYKQGLAYYESVNDLNNIIHARMNLATTLISATKNASPHDQEVAIALLQQNLQEEVVLSDPQQWGKNALNLGHAYAHRVIGHKSLNNEIALHSYLEAMNACSPDLDLVTWAYSKMGFCIELLYCEAFESKKALSLALDHVNTVLSKLDEGFHQLLYARAKLVKASVLINMHGASIEATNPIVFLEKVCDELDHEHTRVEWALAKRRLGQAYFQQKAELSNYLELTNRVFAEALSIFTAQVNPDEYFQIKVTLASEYAYLKEWRKADKLYQEAFAAHSGRLNIQADSLFAKAVLNLGSWNINLASFCALMQGDVKRALEYNEMLRARQALSQSRFNIKQASGSDAEKEEYSYDKLRHMAEQSLGHFWGEERGKILETLQNLYPAHTEDTFLKDSNDIEPANIDHLLSNSDCWILVPFISSELTLLVLLPPYSTAKEAIVSPPIPMGIDKLNEHALKNESNKETFFEAIFELERTGSARSLITQIDNISDFLTEYMGGWLSDVFNAKSIKENDTICMIPQWLLGALPLGLLRLPLQNNKRLEHKYNLTYSSNISSLITTRACSSACNDNKAIALVSGKSDLKSVQAELILIQEAALDCDVLDAGVDKKTVRSALENTNYWHFATHGKFDWFQPTKTSLDFENNPPHSLELADGSHLEIQQIAHLNTKLQLRLVVLSACESGIYDFTDPLHEFYGLSSAFLRIGAMGVISTLWPVGDEFSAVFMSYFYCKHIREKLPPAEALRQSKNWICNASSADIMDHLKVIWPKEQRDLMNNSNLYKGLNSMPDNAKPFEHPIFWGGYILYGS